MKIDAKNRAIYFDNDAEFYDYAVTPLLTVTNSDNTPFMDWEFTATYRNALADNTKFIICDDNSQICKHQAVSYRTITKPVCVQQYNRLADIAKKRKLREKSKQSKQ